MDLGHNLFPDERILYRSTIYRRATLRSMIRDHYAGTCPLGCYQLDHILFEVPELTKDLRGILYRVLARLSAAAAPVGTA